MSMVHTHIESHNYLIKLTFCCKCWMLLILYMRLNCPRNSLDIITEEIVAKTVITIDYLAARPKRQWIIIYNYNNITWREGGGGVISTFSSHAAGGEWFPASIKFWTYICMGEVAPSSKFIAVCSCKSSRAKTFLMCPSSNLQVLVLLANRMEWRCAFGCSHKPFLVNKNSSKRKLSFSEHLNQAVTLKSNRRNCHWFLCHFRDLSDRRQQLPFSAIPSWLEFYPIRILSIYRTLGTWSKC